jgi:TonB family protein
MWLDSIGVDLRTSSLFAILLLMAGKSSAQPSRSFFFHPFVVIKGSPYSGEEVQESVQIQADGSQVARRATRKLFRDVEGRLRIERTLSPAVLRAANSLPPPYWIEIWDPVAGFQFTWGPYEKTATRVILTEARPPGSTGVLLELPMPDQGVQPAGESLGTRSIEGVSAEGRLQSTTVPTYKTDTSPIAITLETWTSPELKILLFAKSVNPHLGTEETRMTNLSLSDPPPDMFRPPPDYAIVDRDPRTIPLPAKPGTPLEIFSPSPGYTPEARAAGVKGPVQLSLTIGADGIPRDIRVIKPLDPGLDQKAIEAVTKWRFRPAQKDGQPIEGQLVGLELAFWFPN